MSYGPKAVGLVLVGRALDAGELGVFGVLTAAVAVIAVAMPFSSYLSRSRPGSLEPAGGREAAAVFLDLGVVAVVAMIGLLPVGHALLERFGRTTMPRSSYLLAVALLVSSGAVSVGRAWLQSEFKYVGASILTTAPDVAWIVLFAPAAAFGGGLNALLWSRFVVMALAMAYVLRTLPWRQLLATEPRLADVQVVTKFALPLVVVAASLSIIGVADRIVLTRYVGIGDVGRYTYMYLVLGLASAVSAAVQRVATTRAYGQVNLKDEQGAVRSLIGAAAGSFVLTALAGCALVIAAPVVHRLTGKVLLPSATTILLTGLGLGLLSVRMVWQHWFRLHDRTAVLAMLELVLLVCYVALVFALSARFGVLGAAIAMVAANGLGMVLYAGATGRNVSWPAKTST